MFRDLSATQLAVITDVIQHLDKVLPGSSQRESGSRQIGSPRLADDAWRQFSSIAMKTSRFRIFTRNISTAGVGFVSRRPFRLGDRIAFVLGSLREERKIIVAQVTFVRYVRRGMHEMGAEFIQAVRESEAPTALRRTVTA